MRGATLKLRAAPAAEALFGSRDRHTNALKKTARTQSLHISNAANSDNCSQFWAFSRICIYHQKQHRYRMYKTLLQLFSEVDASPSNVAKCCVEGKLRYGKRDWDAGSVVLEDKTGSVVCELSRNVDPQVVGNLVVVLQGTLFAAPCHVRRGVDQRMYYLEIAECRVIETLPSPRLSSRQYMLQCRILSVSPVFSPSRSATDVSFCILSVCTSPAAPPTFALLLDEACGARALLHPGDVYVFGPVQNKTVRLLDGTATTVPTATAAVRVCRVNATVTADTTTAAATAAAMMVLRLQHRIMKRPTQLQAPYRLTQRRRAPTQCAVLPPPPQYTCRLSRVLDYAGVITEQRGWAVFVLDGASG